MDRKRSAEAFSSSHGSRFLTIGEASVTADEQFEAAQVGQGDDGLPGALLHALLTTIDAESFAEGISFVDSSERGGKRKLRKRVIECT